MKKIAIFTEGQTERIFIRECLFRLFDPAEISFSCYELLAHDLHAVPYTFPSVPNQNTKTHFMIVDCHGDEGVLSSIKERECNLIEKGFEAILGLRDMYCKAYHILSRGKIEESVSKRLIENHSEILRQMTHNDKIVLCYAVMEIEAWILAMYNLFNKIKPGITSKYIAKKLGFDLEIIDPQNHFYRPADQLKTVLSLCGKHYDKKEGNIESVCAKIDIQDIDDITKNNRCVNFKKFRDVLLDFN